MNIVHLFCCEITANFSFALHRIDAGVMYFGILFKVTSYYYPVKLIQFAIVHIFVVLDYYRSGSATTHMNMFHQKAKHSLSGVFMC